MANKITTFNQFKLLASKSKTYINNAISNLAGLTSTAISELQSGKQDKLTGKEGQVVGFDVKGNVINVGGPINENIFVNGHFANPINQRGQTEYTDGGYGIDGWRGIMSIENGYVKAKNHILQLIEKPIFDIQLTFSVLLYNGQLLYGTASIPSSNSYERVLFHESSNDDVVVQLLKYEESNNKFMIWSNHEIDAIAAKLELGDHQTLAHQDTSGNWVLNEIPNYALELLKCQRYYRCYVNMIGVLGENWGGVYRSGDITYGTMRTTPAVTIESCTIPNIGEIPSGMFGIFSYDSSVRCYIKQDALPGVDFTGKYIELKNVVLNAEL